MGGGILLVGFFVGVFLPSRVMAVAAATVPAHKGLAKCGCLLLRLSHFQKNYYAGFASQI